jgi:hypothetical protein
MKHIRLLTCSLLTAGCLTLVSLVKLRGGVDNAPPFVLVLLTVVGGVLGVLIVVDTVWHSSRGKGQACRHCGYVRKMAPFRIYWNCPNCGK